MKLVADLHTHTVASTHAYSTMNEMVHKAMSLDYFAMAVTDHGLGMADAPHDWYFGNLRSVPDIIDERFLLLKGVEANAVSLSGKLDMDESALKKLDWVIVSLHQHCVPYIHDEQKATNLWLKIAENPLVDMIGHSEQWQYKYDYPLVTKAFAANNKVVELNANSRISRPGNEDNLREIAICCKKNKVKVSVNSDSHSVYALGNEKIVLEMLKEIDFPEELVINTSKKRLLKELKLHKKPIMKRIENLSEAAFLFSP